MPLAFALHAAPPPWLYLSTHLPRRSRTNTCGFAMTAVWTRPVPLAAPPSTAATRGHGGGGVVETARTPLSSGEWTGERLVLLPPAPIWE